jgi:hypothetical protein
MNFTNDSIFIFVLIVILAMIFVGQGYCENFDPDLSQSYQTVNYNTLKQDCNELTWSPSLSSTKCTVETVVPKGKNVCENNLSPITNNQKECKKKKKDLKKSPTVNLQYDFDLLSSFNDAQINNQRQISNSDKINDILNKNNYELVTDIRSLNSLENDLISNY